MSASRRCRVGRTTVIGYEPEAVEMPADLLTSVKVPSPLLWKSWTKPVGKPRGRS